MWLVVWATRVAGAFEDVGCQPDALVWPTGYELAPTDTLLVVRHYGEGEVGELLLRAPDDSEVAVTRYDLTSGGIHWAVLVPLAPLDAGARYVVETSTVRPYFEVGPDPAELAPPPVPVVRNLEASCEEGSSVDYRLCEVLPITLIALGDHEPQVPTLSDLGEAQLTSSEYPQLSEGLSADLSTTIWLGGFDAAGRFTGWTADPLQMPPAGTRTEERAEGAEGSPGATPTSFSSCPSGAWALESSETLPCPPEPRCGCATGSGGGLPVMALLACLRRPSGRPWRSPARA